MIFATHFAGIRPYIALREQGVSNSVDCTGEIVTLFTLIFFHFRFQIICIRFFIYIIFDSGKLKKGTQKYCLKTVTGVNFQSASNDIGTTPSTPS